MSGFVCCFDRSGRSVEPEFLSTLAEPLETSGRKITKISQGSIGLAFGHPLDAASRSQNGPFTDPRTGLTVTWVGRHRAIADEQVDANSESRSKDLPRTNSDLATFLERGPEFLGGQSGPFVFIALDPRRPEVTIARDHLGSQKVFYFLDQRWSIVASDPTILVRHPAVSSDPDESAVARFLGFGFSQDDRSFFSQIRELPPAHWLEATESEFDVKQYWRFRFRPEYWRRASDQVNSDFLGEVKRSLRGHLANIEPGRVALSLSGGLDSTVLAALVPTEVRSFSWFTEEFPEVEERTKIDAVARHLGISHQWVDAGGLQLFRGDFIERFVHRRSPYINLFAGVKQRLFDVAQSQGCTQIIVGDAGDALYGTRQYWLRDLVASGQSGAVGSLVTTMRDAAQGDALARQDLLRILPADGIRQAWSRLRRPRWLTPDAKALLPPDAFSPILPKGRWRHRFDGSVGTKNSELESEERLIFTNEHRIGRINPFWHWPLLESVLNLPAYWFYRDGINKILVREAMKSLLPGQVLQGARTGLLGNLFLNGLEQNRPYLRETVFLHPRSDWQRYVKRDWIEPYLSPAGPVSFGHTILSRVICFEHWYRKLIQ